VDARRGLRSQELCQRIQAKAELERSNRWQLGIEPEAGTADSGDLENDSRTAVVVAEAARRAMRRFGMISMRFSICERRS